MAPLSGRGQIQNSEVFPIPKSRRPPANAEFLLLAKRGVRLFVLAELGHFRDMPKRVAFGVVDSKNVPHRPYQGWDT
jgi:hypothetical protein